MANSKENRHRGSRLPSDGSEGERMSDSKERRPLRLDEALKALADVVSKHGVNTADAPEAPDSYTWPDGAVCTGADVMDTAESREYERLLRERPKPPDKSTAVLREERRRRDLIYKFCGGYSASSRSRVWFAKWVASLSESELTGSGWKLRDSRWRDSRLSPEEAAEIDAEAAATEARIAAAPRPALRNELTPAEKDVIRKAAIRHREGVKRPPTEDES